MQPFTPEELDQIFRPSLARTLKAQKEKKDAVAKDRRRSSFINTAKPRTHTERRRLAMSAEVDPDDLELKLKDKIESSKHLYDFKYIKTKFKSP